MYVRTRFGSRLAFEPRAEDLVEFMPIKYSPLRLRIEDLGSEKCRKPSNNEGNDFFFTMTLVTTVTVANTIVSRRTVDSLSRPSFSTSPLSLTRVLTVKTKAILLRGLRQDRGLAT